MYGEEIAYDENSNITSLRRMGATNTRRYGLIDDLSFTYQGNRRVTVQDEAGTLSYSGASDFVDGADSEEEYEYDDNGALTMDLNRGITSIEYDNLGNPKKITFTDNRSIEYVYSADGIKFRAIHKKPGLTAWTHYGGTVVLTWRRDTADYIGNLILKNSHPEMLQFDGGYASFSHDTIDGLHYYIRDYQGSNRMVLSSDGTIEQVTHYYPYGGVIGDISTNESLQAYKFEGKELDRTFGLDNYDIHARQYFAMAPMWDRIDPLAEKYYGISPYAYCGGDPVNLGDYDGKRVKPKGDESLSIILNTLPVEARQYIILDQEGYIDQETMKQYKGDSDNFSSLLALASDPIEITVTTLETIKYVMNGSEDTEYFTYIEGPTCPDDYDKDFKSCIGNTTGETGNLGVTYMPTNGGKGKADAVNPNSIHININPHLSSVGAAETFSHEGYGHAFIYVNTNGDRSRAIHHPVNDGTKTIETNQELFERSIKARKETIKNMGQ